MFHGALFLILKTGKISAPTKDNSLNIGITNEKKVAHCIIMKTVCEGKKPFMAVKNTDYKIIYYNRIEYILK